MTGGVSEENVRDPNHPSHPQTYLYKGISDNHVRDEHILVETKSLHQSVEAPDFSVEPPHFVYVGSIFIKKQKTFGYSKKNDVICASYNMKRKL